MTAKTELSSRHVAIEPKSATNPNALDNSASWSANNEKIKPLETTHDNEYEKILP